MTDNKQQDNEVTLEIGRGRKFIMTIACLVIICLGLIPAALVPAVGNLYSSFVSAVIGILLTYSAGNVGAKLAINRLPSIPAVNVPTVWTQPANLVNSPSSTTISFDQPGPAG